MSLTWTAIGLLLFLITPGLSFFIGYRFMFPRIRTMAPRESSLYILCCLANVIVNWKLFSNFLNSSLRDYKTITRITEGEVDWMLILASKIVAAREFHPLRPGLQILSWFNERLPPENVIGIVFDLHVRCAFAAAVILPTVAMLGRFADKVELWEHEKELKVQQSGAAANRIESELPSENWFVCAVVAIREAVYHPWTYAARNNKRRELLMVDVLTHSDGLYSGAFTQWIPNMANDFAAISLTHVLHYKPKFGDKSGEAPAAPSPSGTQGQKKPDSGRKKRFVANNGELIIPAASISNVHFWEIRKGTSFIVHVYSMSDVETVKFYLTLSYIREGMISKIEALFALDTKEEEMAAMEKLRAWMNLNSIRNDPHLANILKIYRLPAKGKRP